MTTRDESIDWRLVGLVFAATAAVLVVRALFSAGTVPLFNDTDDAMRLVEVRDFLAGQGWFDNIQHRLNAPYGAPMHWSHLIDAGISGLVLLLSPLGRANAEVVAAYVWPLLLFLAMLSISGAIAVRLAGREALLPGLVLPAVSLVTWSEFIPGRIDHHSVQIVLTLLMAWFALGALAHPRHAIGAGIAAATALAIGAESLPGIVAAIFAFGIAWVADVRFARAMRLFGFSLFAGMVVHFGIAVPPERWLIASCDMISPVYVSVAGVVAIGLGVLSVLPAAGRWALVRLGAGIVVGGLALGVILLAFPDCLRGPYGALDPWLVTHWINKIAEAKPIWSDFSNNGPYLVAVSLPVLLALGACAWWASSASGRRARWVIYLGFVALTGLIMVLQVRGARLATPLALPALAALIVALRTDYLSKRHIGSALAMVVVWFAGAGLATGLVAAALLPKELGAETAQERTEVAECRMPSSYSQLAALPPQNVMAPIDLGSHLLAFTPHSVVGAPYHRDGQGVRDTFQFFNGSMEDARAIASERKLGLLVVCPGMPELRGMDDTAPDALIHRLAQGDLPDWLTPLPAAGPLQSYVIAAP